MDFLATLVLFVRWPPGYNPDIVRSNKYTISVQDIRLGIDLRYSITRVKIEEDEYRESLVALGAS